MKILLIKPPWAIFTTGTYNLPLGLCYLASSLREAGFGEVRIYNCDMDEGEKIEESTIQKNYERYIRSYNLDNPIWDELRAYMKEFRPDIIGITIMTPEYTSALNVISIAKEILPHSIIIGGGIHPTILPERTLVETDTDFLVIGEGELTLPELVLSLKRDRSFHDLRGVAYKSKGKVVVNSSRPFIKDLDQIPFPARDLLVNQKNIPVNCGLIITSRGCPSKCIFCASHKLWSRRVRFRSPENICKELLNVKSLYGTSHFRFTDDSFTLNKERIISLCQLIIDQNLEISWECDTKPEFLDEELLIKMKESGCVQINIGIESGNERIRRLIRKEPTLDKIEKIVALIKREGIRVVGYFMFGFPTESKEDMEETLNFMERLGCYPCVSLATPYPGTEMWEMAVSSNKIPQNLPWEAHFHHSPKLPNISETNSEDFVKIAIKADEIQREYLRTQTEEELERRIYRQLSSLYSNAARKKIALFGVGKLGSLCLRYLPEFDVEIVAVVDSDLAKQGMVVEGFEILPPSILDKFEVDEVLVTSIYFLEIHSRLRPLEEKGIKIQVV
ncbi:TPA: hypothetical protein DCX15_02925 [bacterium]|nr:hypothetical protein [bacterium]